jgi:hypothetical protein
VKALGVSLIELTGKVVARRTLDKAVSKFLSDLHPHIPRVRARGEASGVAETNRRRGDSVLACLP